MDWIQQEYYALRDTLTEFTKTAKLPPALCFKLRNYFRSRYQQGSLFDWSVVISRLSEQLKEEVASCMQSAWLRGNDYFKDATSEQLAAVASIVVQRSFVKGESLISLQDEPDTLFVVRQGLVMSEGQLLGVGRLVGEDMLYFAVGKALKEGRAEMELRGARQDISPYEYAVQQLTAGNKSSRSAHSALRDFRSIAISFTVACQIREEHLLMIFRSHPDFLKEVKLTVIKKTFKQHVMAYAKAYNRMFLNHSNKILLGLNIDNVLVDWYASKLKSLAFYNQEDTLPHILKLQGAMRAYLGKLRFRQVCLLLAKDPQVMHKQLMDRMQRVENTLLAIPKAGVAAGVDVALSSSDELQRRIQLNEATLKHCTGQIAMFENMMRIAKLELEKDRKEVSMRSPSPIKFSGDLPTPKPGRPLPPLGGGASPRSSPLSSPPPLR